MLARFVPVVRTVLNPMVGALDVPARTFTIWQVAGGLTWSVGVTMIGFGLGSTISSVEVYLLPIIAVIIVVSMLPLVIEFLRGRKARRHKPGQAERLTTPAPTASQVPQTRTSVRSEG